MITKVKSTDNNTSSSYTTKAIATVAAIGVGYVLIKGIDIGMKFKGLGWPNFNRSKRSNRTDNDANQNDNIEAISSNTSNARNNNNIVATLEHVADPNRPILHSWDDNMDVEYVANLIKEQMDIQRRRSSSEREKVLVKAVESAALEYLVQRLSFSEENNARTNLGNSSTCSRRSSRKSDASLDSIVILDITPSSSNSVNVNIHVKSKTEKHIDEVNSNLRDLSSSVAEHTMKVITSLVDNNDEVLSENEKERKEDSVRALAAQFEASAAIAHGSKVVLGNLRHGIILPSSTTSGSRYDPIFRTKHGNK